MNHRAYLLKRKRAARVLLDDPTRTDAQRHGARIRLNLATRDLKAMPPVPRMRRGLDIDRIPVWLRPTLVA